MADNNEELLDKKVSDNKLSEEVLDDTNNMIEDDELEEIRFIKEKSKKDKKNKSGHKGIGFKVFMLVAAVMLIVIQIGLIIGFEVMFRYEVYYRNFDQAWKDESVMLQNRYAIMILANQYDDQTIEDIASPHLKYGIVESSSSNLTEDDLADLDNYVINNFDADFNIHKCNVFSAKIDETTYFNYGMNTIFEGAYLGHYSNVSPDPLEPALYKYVVSYVHRPTEIGSLTDSNLFVQLYTWLTLAYQFKYLIIVVQIIVAILILVEAIYWIGIILKLIYKFYNRLKFVPRTTLTLMLFTIVGGLFFYQIDEELCVLFIIGDIFVIVPFVIYFSYQSKVLCDACEKLAAGDMDVHINDKGFIGNFKKQAKSINVIRDSINLAVDERMKSERLKTELITNVSHDIKTPLTSIINYVDLLGKEEFDNDKAREYIDVLDRQSVRLKKLIMDLIEASKATTGNVDLNMLPCDAKLILEQVVGEYQEKMDDQHLSLVVRTPESSATIMADSKALFRIFDNLLVNIQKYSLENTRAYVDLELVSNKAVFIFRNTSREALAADGSLFMERFYQGDISRSAEGNGLGLAVAKSLTELMGGEIQVITDGDLFKVTISFDICID